MLLNTETKAFIREHTGDDLSKLLLSASRFPEIDIPFAVNQIAARRQIKEKLPDWYKLDDLIFPSKVAAEQCSSEQTGKYKQRLIKPNENICDLTGGLGVDSFFLSQKAGKLLYIERYKEYVEVARHNFAVLDVRNIEIRQGDAVELISSLPDQDVFYIDPARRGKDNKRMFALSDCEPDLPALLPVLLEKAPKVIAKVSPMADIQQTLNLLPQTGEVHVLSVNNECKELLFVIDKDRSDGQIPIYCIDMDSRKGEERGYMFTMDEERGALPQMASIPGSYLYEPNASLMKAGAFKSIAIRFELRKLNTNSHLYTSDQLIEKFPGRVFKIKKVIPFQSKTVRSLANEYPQANIAVRNFPLTVEEFRKRTRIRDGGDVYLFLTTLADGNRVVIEGEKT